MKRVVALTRHLRPLTIDAESEMGQVKGNAGTTLPNPEALQAFVTDPAWAGRPFWMLNVLRFRGGPGGEGEARYQEYGRLMTQDTLPQAGGRVVLKGYARTVIGRREYHCVAIVEYPSPEAFFRMATSGPMAEKNKVRLQGLEEQYLIPMRPGWFQIDRPAPVPTRPFTQFNEGNVWSVPNGMVGSAVEDAREGETSASRAQAEAFVRDQRLGANNKLWHLNLLKFKEGSGEETYGQYAKAMGKKETGTLALFGARSTLASTCYRSLIGESDFNRAIIAEYPCKDSFLSMGASQEYFKTAHFRHQGLEETYIISILPEFVDTAPVKGL